MKGNIMKVWRNVQKSFHRLVDKWKTRKRSGKSLIRNFASEKLITTQVFAHRGSKGNRPENTLAAFEEALKTGCDGIELDVHLTADQELVVIHDESVDRTTDGEGYIRNLTMAAIKELDAGSWFSKDYRNEKVPTLREVLQFLKDRDFKGILNIEIKTDKYVYPNIEQLTSDLVAEMDLPFQHIYCSFNLQSLKILKLIEPQTEMCYLMGNQPALVTQGMRDEAIDTLHPKFTWVQKHMTRARHTKKPIRPWVLNSPEEMMTAYNLHLAGFMTDYPEVAMMIRERMNRIEPNVFEA
jgi:glycerophosphoryl diester phosphodiesterase